MIRRIGLFERDLHSFADKIVSCGFVKPIHNSPFLAQKGQTTLNFLELYVHQRRFNDRCSLSFGCQISDISKVVGL